MALAAFYRLLLGRRERDSTAAPARIASVRAAFALLADHLRLGRPAEDVRRELVLARGRDACVAKYRWRREGDVVLVLAVRHAREAGFSEDD